MNEDLLSPSPVSLEIVREDMESAALVGSSFLGMANVNRVVVRGGNASPVEVNNQLTVPAGTTRAVITFNYVNTGFGHGTIVEGPFARFAFQVAPISLSGTLLTFKVWAFFRNGNGGNPWESTIDVSAMCFG